MAWAYNAVVSFDLFLQIYLAIFGLLIGSYLNVVIYRLPRRISTVLPSSRCPRCLQTLRPWENVPVLSYLLLRGRCGRCGVTISWRYPFVEALTAFFFVASYRTFRDSYTAVAVACVFCAVMVVLAMIDFEHFLLPDVITYPTLVLALVVLPAIDWAPAKDLWLGAVAGAGVLAAVAWGWYAVKGVHGMGMGDVKMLAMIGAVLGWQGMGLTLLLASLAGSVVGVLLMVTGQLRLGSKLPFGVFLALGALVTLFFHQHLVEVYRLFAIELHTWVLS